MSVDLRVQLWPLARLSSQLWVPKVEAEEILSQASAGELKI